MSRIKYATNSPHTQGWIERIGKLILNFSAIEFESIHWLIQLSEREFDIEPISRMPFASRATQVMRHVDERKVGDKWRKQSLRRWNEALKLAHIRNQVAHNPIVFGWSQLPEVGAPNVLGVPNLRAGGRRNAQWLLSTDHADKSINSMVEVARSLADLRTEWCAARDQGRVAPVKVSPSLWYRLRRRVGMAAFSVNARRSA